MDPLSITASIIAILQITNAVVSICYDYSSATRNSSQELVIEEVKSLRNILENLEQLAKRAEVGDPTAEQRLPALKLLCEPGGPMVKSLLELGRLQKKLTPPDWVGQDRSTRKAIVLALGWPLKEGDTNKTLEKIGRFKYTLGLALTADQT
jgi:hypothetical protein